LFLTSHDRTVIFQDGDGHNRYDDGGCVKERQCSLCNFRLLPRAMLRGLCKNDYVDVFYTIMWDEPNNLPFFKGFSGSRINYDEDSESWLLTTKDNSVNGTCVAPIKPMGTGAMTWQFNKDICSTNSLEPFDAVMTVCKRDEFTCNSDGACIAMEERCDQFPNCEDFSDEANCQLVVLPDNYVKDYAPFTVDQMGELKKVTVLIKARICLSHLFSHNYTSLIDLFGRKITLLFVPLSLINLERCQLLCYMSSSIKYD
jgi:hypothetical protein